MSYSGSTATTPNPPQSCALPLTRGSSSLAGAEKPGLWLYKSTNLTTDIVAANFFTDGWYLGMRAGDIVQGVQYTSAGSSVISFIGVIASVTTNGASLSTGGTMTSTFA